MSVTPDSRGLVSVVVACSDHGEIAELLDALESQTAAAEIGQVIIVNPGHQLDPADAEALRRSRRLPVEAYSVAGGRAAAWNRGLAAAHGELVILLADDFVPNPALVARHLELHHSDPAPGLVGIGPSRFPDSIRADPFPRWLEDSGSLFGVSFTLADELPDGWFYCANTSAKRGFLTAAGGFDERFPDDAGDDAEFGRRLAAAGMHSVLLPEAVAIHEHRVTLDERIEAVEKGGRSQALHDAKYPPPHPWNTGDESRIPPSWWAVTRARARALARSGPEAREVFYRQTLERARLRAYHATRSELAAAG